MPGCRSLLGIAHLPHNCRVVRQQVEAERAAVLAKERASLERLLTAISATLNRDLPLKLAEAVRGEMEGMATGLAAAVGPAVQAALATSLSKVCGGCLGRSFQANTRGVLHQA